jgi:hypothetical protein
VAETTVKRLPWCGCWRTGKAMGQVYQCWWRICREMFSFSIFEYHMFYVLYQFMSYLLIFPRINTSERFSHCFMSFIVHRIRLLYTLWMRSSRSLSPVFAVSRYDPL